MSHVNATLAVSANRGSGRSCTDSASPMHLHAALVAAVRKVFPVKTWAQLAALFKVSERTAKYRLACKREFTAHEIAQLLRSEGGQEVLATLMADTTPVWWLRYLEQTDLHTARRKAARLKRELQETLNAVDATAAAIARAEHAAVISDEEFHRPHVDALRSMAGVRNRTVAAATNRRGR
jgi:hypothetical protein